MKKILVVILTISILSIALLPISVYANDSNILSIDFYLYDNISTSFHTAQMSTDIISQYDWNGIPVFYITVDYVINNNTNCMFMFSLYYPNSNSILGDVSTYSFVNFYNMNGQVDNSVRVNTQGKINYIYDFSSEQFYNFDMAYSGVYNYIPYEGNIDLVLCYNNVDVPRDPNKGVYVFNLINGDTVDGDTIYSRVLYESEITEFVGSSNWVCNELFYGYKVFDLDNFVGHTSYLYMKVINYDDNTESYLPICELSPAFVINVKTMDGSFMVFYPGDSIDLNLLNSVITPDGAIGLKFTLSSNYLNLTDIYVNVYNYNASALYDSDYYRGTFLDYSIGFTIAKYADGTVQGDIFLNILGNTEMVSYSFAFNLNSHGIEDFKGVSFNMNQTVIDVPFDGTEKTVVYTGTFIPTSDCNILSLYLITSDDLANIKVTKSNDYLKDSENKLNHYNDSMNRLEDEKSGFKAEGGYRVNSTVNQLQSVMQTFNNQAPQMNNIFKQVYDFPIVLTMLTLVLSVALISYVLYGKKG